MEVGECKLEARSGKLFVIRVITANDCPQPHCVRQFIVNKRQQRVCCCGEGIGKKIKAISCELSAVS